MTGGSPVMTQESSISGSWNGKSHDTKTSKRLRSWVSIENMANGWDHGIAPNLALCGMKQKNFTATDGSSPLGILNHQQQNLVGGPGPPLWKIWVRQLGWWHSYGKITNGNQSPPTRKGGIMRIRQTCRDPSKVGDMECHEALTLVVEGGRPQWKLVKSWYVWRITEHKVPNKHPCCGIPSFMSRQRCVWWCPLSVHFCWNSIVGPKKMNSN